MADYYKEYISSIATASITLALKDYNKFISKFNLRFKDKLKNTGYESTKTIVDIDQTYIFNYRELSNDMICFDLVGPRTVLRSVNKWINT